MPPSKFEGSPTLYLQVRYASFSISISVSCSNDYYYAYAPTSWFSQHTVTFVHKFKNKLARSLSTLFGLVRVQIEEVCISEELL